MLESLWNERNSAEAEEKDMSAPRSVSIPDGEDRPRAKASHQPVTKFRMLGRQRTR